MSDMKIWKAMVVVLLVGLAAAGCYWAGYVHGSSAASGYKMSDLLGGVGLLLILLLVIAKLLFALIVRGDGRPPFGGGGRSGPPFAPLPVKPSGPIPPKLPVIAEKPLRAA